MAGFSKDTDEILTKKMRAIEWRIVCYVSPQWAQAYLEQFRALSGSVLLILAKAQLLEQTLVPHVEGLKRQGKFPNFFELRAQALRELAEQEGVS